MSDYWARVHAFRPSLWRLLLTVGITLIVWLGLLAVLYNLYLLRLGFDARTVGLLNGLGSLVWGLAALPAGLLSNRIGLRSSIQLGLGLFGLGITLTLLVESFAPTLWLPWLLGCQVVMNVGIAFATVNVPPYIMAVTGEDQRPHAFAFLSALNPLAALVGSLIAGVLPGLLGGLTGMGVDQPGPYRLALWAGPLICFLGILPLIGAEPGVNRMGSRHGPEGRQFAAPFGLLALWAWIVFLAAIGEGTVRTFFNVLLDTGFEVPPATIGLVMGAAQLLPIFIALGVPLLFTRWGAGYTLFGGILGLAFCLIPFVFGAQLNAQLPGRSMAAFGLVGGAYLATAAVLTMIRAARNLLGQELVIPYWRTSSQGAAMLGLAFGLAVAGTVGGQIIQVWGFSFLFMAGAFATLLSAACLFIYLHHTSRPQAGQTLAEPL